MNKGVLWLAALCAALVVVASPRIAWAGEFCPAGIAQVAGVAGNPAAYAVRLTAFSPRNVTGQLFLETDAGWYRAPFAPMPLQKNDREIESAAIYVRLPKAAALRNVWLAQAASDNPLWRVRGVVNCAPDPERHIAQGSVPKTAPDSQAVSALGIPAPISYDCKTPFADAKVQSDSMYSEPLGVGDYVAAEIDLDASGKPVDVVAINASGEDFELKKRIEKHAKYMRFSPAIAYCRPVPSIYILKEAGLQ